MKKRWTADQIARMLQDVAKKTRDRSKRNPQRRGHREVAMQPRLVSIAILIGLAGLATPGARAEAPAPIVHTVRFPEPARHAAEVEATFPTAGQASLELMMPVWSPGYYRVEDYARRIRGLAARAPDGTALAVERPRENRWRIATGGHPEVTVSYRLDCEQRSVTTNWVAADLVVLNGAATFLTTAGQAGRAHEVRLVLPPTCRRSMSAMAPAPDGRPDHYRAEDYDTLVDSPIVAGDLSTHEFEVDGSRHILVDVGDLGPWDGRAAAADLEKIVAETRRFWGFLPFRRYLFLNLFRPGRGGLEHRDCALLSAATPKAGSPQRPYRWLSFVSHEYFHAFNVKRLRPIELGPFDYETPPRTGSLWISEGLTTYFGDLIIVRAGLGTPADLLGSLSSSIGQLQSSPGRLAQTLEQSSLDVWGSGVSGVGRDPATKVSYYVKGPVVGFLLDARIRRATGDERGLEDVMRLAYRRYSGRRGFTAGEFRATAEEVAGVDLADWFRRAVSSTEELDYAEALDWFGLQFAPSGDASGMWRLEVREDAAPSRRRHWERLLAPSGDSRRSD
jgi:predicted metalloprotease with PDZ domain